MSHEWQTTGNVGETARTSTFRTWPFVLKYTDCLHTPNDRVCAEKFADGLYSQVTYGGKPRCKYDGQ